MTTVGILDLRWELVLYLSGLALKKQQQNPQFSYNIVQFSTVQSFSPVQSFSRVPLVATPWIATRQASLSITNLEISPRFMSIQLVVSSSHLIHYHPLYLLSTNPPSIRGDTPMSQLFTWSGQSIGVSASASVLPMNTQDWSPLGWTGWISLQSKGLSRAFSNATIQKHQFYST